MDKVGLILICISWFSFGVHFGLSLNQTDNIKNEITKERENGSDRSDSRPKSFSLIKFFLIFGIVLFATVRFLLRLP